MLLFASRERKKRARRRPGEDWFTFLELSAPTALVTDDVFVDQENIVSALPRARFGVDATGNISLGRAGGTLGRRRR